MSQVVLNRGNVDVTDVQIEQAGSASAEIMTEAPLLDSTKDYVMGVTSLVVPLTEEPMITYDVNNAQLMTVHRRKWGAQMNHAESALNLAGLQTLSLDAAFKIFSVTDLVTYLANWSTRLSNAIADAGLTSTNVAGRLQVNEDVAPNHASMDARRNNGVRLLGFTLTPGCLLYTSPSPRDQRGSRMAASA